jgi:hypothetical protein
MHSNNISGIHAIKLFRKSVLKYFDPYIVFRLAKLLRENNVQICVVNHPFFSLSALIACKLLRCRLVTYAHNLEHRRQDGVIPYARPIFFLLEFLAYRLSDGVFFLSKTELTDAIKLFKLNHKRCFFVPHIACSQKTPETLHINSSRNFKIVFFGDFSYQPNKVGLYDLFTNIIPLLAKQSDFQCLLTIFGGSLPNTLPKLPSVDFLTINFLGFLDSPEDQIQSADVMINPVCLGAGVQTKIITALSLGTTVISAHGGTRGIDMQACGDKLLTVPDKDWGSYVAKLIEVRNRNSHLSPTPKSFYSIYSEKNVVSGIMSAFDALEN